jgi:CxxC-x17-CxxC domain-containing protein
MAEREIGVAELEAYASASAQAELSDTNIQCIDCSKDFVWSAGEQAFFRDKKLENPPKRCKECKKAKNERLAAIEHAQRSGIKQRIEVKVSCARCTETTTVPFYPTQGRPVYCRSCFLELNPSLLNGNGNGHHAQ